jgi:hypothetical protein
MTVGLLLLRLLFGGLLIGHGCQKSVGWFHGPGPVAAAALIDCGPHEVDSSLPSSTGGLVSSSRSLGRVATRSTISSTHRTEMALVLSRSALGYSVPCRRLSGDAFCWVPNERAGRVSAPVRLTVRLTRLVQRSDQL